MIYLRLEDLDEVLSYEEKLEGILNKQKVKSLTCFEIEDAFFREQIFKWASGFDISLEFFPSPMFLSSPKDFETYVGKRKKPFMKTFYEGMRKKHGILLDADGGPAGGKWSFDTENRKKLPKDVTPPDPIWKNPGQVVAEVSELVEKEFPDHPGSLQNFGWPTSRTQALKVLRHFIQERLESFGPYEDAFTLRSETVFHSLLSPLLNMGLLTPKEVIQSICQAYEDRKLPIASIEGFVRQVLGWREFIRGINHCFGEKEEKENYFGHRRKMKACWYEGNTGITPLDDVIKKAQSLGYCHHIERLMVLSNVMLLCEVDPKEVYRWFMEMFVDSADWVMGPNVYGMGQFSDGGIFATKPYICGSNYWRKMSDYPKGDWCDTLDGLYWRFIEKHKARFEKNHRMVMMTRLLAKQPKEKMIRHRKNANAFIQKVTSE